MNAQTISQQLKSEAQKRMKNGEVSAYLKTLLQLMELQKLQSFGRR